MNERIFRSWALTVFKDPNSDDLMLELPVSLLEAANWNAGDTLKWKMESGEVILVKVDDELSLSSD